MKKAIGYCFVKLSLDNWEAVLEKQQQEIQEYCDQNGYELTLTVSDIGHANNRLSESLGIKRILEIVKTQPIDVVITSRIDRLGRNTNDVTRFVSKLKKHGVSLCSVVEKIDSSPTSQFFFHVLESSAELERDLQRKQLRTA